MSKVKLPSGQIIYPEYDGGHGGASCFTALVLIVVGVILLFIVLGLLMAQL